MSTRSFLAVLAAAALVAPVSADISDGHGGRTSPHGSPANEPAVTVHACCPKAVPAARQVASSPAELKAMGHLAWVSRANDPIAAPACFKRVAHRPVQYRSPAELKASAHLAVRSAAATKATAGTCCESGRCPMRRAS